MEYNAIWIRSRELIKERMTDFSYKSWIEILEPVALHDHALVLLVPDRDIHKTLLDFYLKDLNECCKSVDPSLTGVELILPEQRGLFVDDGQQEDNGSLTLNPKYTFDSFIVGNSNQFPHAAALAVAKKPGAEFNPLFIYGGVGLGKTHLMHAIGHYIKEHNPKARVMYVTCETFSNELITAIQNNKTPEFRKRYREVDILMIDDVQFISRSQSGQEEFFNTFNSLYMENKAIVISSDRPPKEISKLEERLCSRFQQGLITDIQPPDWETRCAILQQKAINDQMELDDEVAYFIADKVKANIRELEGALNKVVYYAKLNQKSRIDLAIAKEALRGMLPEDEPPKLSISLIQKAVADYYQITVDDLKSKKKDRFVTYPRQIAMYLCRELMGATQPQIGRDFGNRDHSTVIHACNRISEARSTDAQLERGINEITAILRGSK